MRIVLGVIVAFISMSIFIFGSSIAPWYLFGVDRVLQPENYDATIPLSIYSVLVAMAGSFLGGFICSAIGRSRVGVIVLAILSFSLGIMNAVGQSAKPEPGKRDTGLTVMQVVQMRKEPAWFIFLIPVLGSLGVLAGGRNAGRTTRYPREYETETKIHATPAEVWAILTDAAGYETWNPEIVGIEGKIDPGGKIIAHVGLGSGSVQKVSLLITAFEPGSMMEWTGGLPYGLFVGRRTFTVEPADEGTNFRMHLSMTGLFASIILRSVGDRQPEIDSFTSALKTYAEKTKAADSRDH